MTARINNLNTDIPQLKEELLTLQAELRINIDEYNRLKLCVTKSFTDYCINKYQIPTPTNQMAEVKQIFHKHFIPAYNNKIIFHSVFTIN